MLQRKPRLDSSTGRPSIEDCLPQDALEAIMGHLDQEAICSARLVSKAFCAAASAHVCSLSLESTYKAVSFHRYPNVKHVTVSHAYLNLSREESLAHLDPGLRNLATALTIIREHWGDDDEEGEQYEFEEEEYEEEEEEDAGEMDRPLWSRLAKRANTANDQGGREEEESDEVGDDDENSNDGFDKGEEGEEADEDEEGNDDEVEEEEGEDSPIAQTRDYLSQVALMPKLRKLEVRGVVEHEAALLARCTNLEAIDFHDCTLSVARTIVSLTQLTSIHFGSVLRDGSRSDSPDISWVGSLTTLNNLQALCICTFGEAVPLIGNLTGLTWLTLSVEGTPSIAPLMRLTRLRYLYIASVALTEGELRIACSLGSGSLTSLHLSFYEEASAECGKLLSGQTALTELGLCGQLCNLRHLGPLRFEQLQSLAIDDFDRVDGEGLSVLSRATALTYLLISTRACITGPRIGMTQVLAQLTQLRSLSWSCPWYEINKVSELPLALGPLTGLTKLRLHSPGLDDGYLRSLLVLTGLRELELRNGLLTDEVLPELGTLTNLSTLTVLDCGVMSLAPVRQVSNPLRKARGLRPLHTSM